MNSYSSHYKWVKTSAPGSHPVYSYINTLAGMSKEELDARWERLKEAQTKRYQVRAARGGWTLAVYHWEAETYPSFKKVRCDREEAKKFLKKFSRHFKTSTPYLDGMLVKHGDAGHWVMRYGSPFIALGKNPSLGTICHEYAHHLDNSRNHKSGHSKTFKRELKKVYTFAKRYLPVDKPVA